MSTLTQAQPGTTVPARLLSMPLAVTFLAEFTSLTSFFLLAVMPMLTAAAGAGSSGAGLITGSLLLGTVAAEAVAAAAIRRFGCRMVLAAGAVALGVPALAMLAREPQVVMVSVSVVRGLGFGLCGVVTGVLTAKLLPPGRRVLVCGGRLAGVIDVGDLGPADPALDLVGAWHLLEARPRQALRDDLECTDLEWERGKAWAFEQSMGAVWYYVESNPAMSLMGQRTLHRIMADASSS